MHFANAKAVRQVVLFYHYYLIDFSFCKQFFWTLVFPFLYNPVREQIYSVSAY